MSDMKAEYIDHMGSDLSVINAARVSFNKKHDVFDDEKDTKLINFLAKHKHEIPFAHTAITLRMEAPVPIRTQCFKSKIGFCENEESRRYISYKPEYFIPEYFRRKPTGGAKQGSSDKHIESDYWLVEYEEHCKNAIELYEDMIADGLCAEQSRFVLPQGVIVKWIWTGSLLAFARFYNLRTDSHAQKEIQDLAKEVGEVIKKLYPVSWRALTSNNK